MTFGAWIVAVASGIAFSTWGMMLFTILNHVTPSKPTQAESLVFGCSFGLGVFMGLFALMSGKNRAREENEISE